MSLLPARSACQSTRNHLRPRRPLTERGNGGDERETKGVGETKKVKLGSTKHRLDAGSLEMESSREIDRVVGVGL